jgi:5S rRNA maturation endonuclease (ribonuclease M5)
MAEELDNFDIIRDNLSRLGGRQKAAGDWKMVCCPFPDHQDNSPSCGVYLRKDNPYRQLGSFNCLGCGKHGDWNKFAEVAGLEKIKAWNSKETKVEYDPLKDMEAMLSSDVLTMRAVYRAMKCPEAQPWPIQLNWRGISGELVAAVGGRAVNDVYNNSLAVLFPIKIGKQIRGAVKAIYQKKDPNQLGYITMNGAWVKQYGLFPYAYTSKLINDNGFDFVILVEGPRDALRLLSLGLPAIAVLGANTIGKTKMLYVKSLGVSNVYVMPDNDKGGTMLWNNVKAMVKADTRVRRLKLPREKDENGKLIKMDPFSAPAYVLREVKQLMRDRHGWRRPR